MAMGKTNNPEILNGLFEGGNIPNAQIVVMTGDAHGVRNSVHPNLQESRHVAGRKDRAKSEFT